MIVFRSTLCFRELLRAPVRESVIGYRWRSSMDAGNYMYCMFIIFHENASNCHEFSSRDIIRTRPFYGDIKASSPRNIQQKNTYRTVESSYYTGTITQLYNTVRVLHLQKYSLMHPMIVLVGVWGFTSNSRRTDNPRQTCNSILSLWIVPGTQWLIAAVRASSWVHSGRDILRTCFPPYEPRHGPIQDVITHVRDVRRTSLLMAPSRTWYLMYGLSAVRASQWVVPGHDIYCMSLQFYT